MLLDKYQRWAKGPHSSGESNCMNPEVTGKVWTIIAAIYVAIPSLHTALLGASATLRILCCWRAAKGIGVVHMTVDRGVSCCTVQSLSCGIIRRSRTPLDAPAPVDVSHTLWSNAQAQHWRPPLYLFLPPAFFLLSIGGLALIYKPAPEYGWTHQQRSSSSLERPCPCSSQFGYARADPLPSHHTSRALDIAPSNP